MRRSAGHLRRIGAAFAALALTGCVTLLPKTKEVDLYRFGQPESAEAKVAPSNRVAVFRSSGSFQHESAGDRLLTLSSGKIAYIAETRWAAPATTLWDQAVLGAFDANGGQVRLVSRGEPGAADYVMRLDVRQFETRFEQGAKRAPTVVVRVRVALTGGRSKTLQSERIFETQIKARENRVAAIVTAYDQAVIGLLKDVVSWTNETATPS